jgi:RHS repeat-associated protein
VKESFTAFGNRRNQCTWDGPPTNGTLTKINSATRRGFTWQTALGNMGLNDMNGRIQDAITGRFLSADPYIPDPDNTQSFNRYSYALNNPVSYTDPSGFAQVAIVPGTTPEVPPPPIPCDFSPSCPGGIPSIPFPGGIPGWDILNGGCVFGHPALCQMYWDQLVAYENWLREHTPGPAQPTPPAPPPPPSYLKGPTVAQVAKGPEMRKWPQEQSWLRRTWNSYIDWSETALTPPYTRVVGNPYGGPLYDMNGQVGASRQK